MKLFEEKLRKFQENSRLFGTSNKVSSVAEINYNNYNTNPKNEDSPPKQSETKSNTLHYRFTEKRRLYKSTNSMANLHVSKDIEEVQKYNLPNEKRKYAGVTSQDMEDGRFGGSNLSEIEELKLRIAEMNENLKKQEILIRESDNKNSRQTQEISQLNKMISVNLTINSESKKRGKKL